MDNEIELLLANHGEEPDESILLNAIIEKVEDLLKYDQDLIMSYLYRLDVDESKIINALSSPEGMMPARVLGELILKRQKERLRTREKYKNDSIDYWDF